MTTPLVTIQLDPAHRNYAPGGTLAGRFRWDVGYPDKVRSVELSILWYTEGKGDEDSGVHYFEEHSASDRPGERPAWRPFATKLPSSPLSYDGVMVKIRWCVRVRVFLESGKDVVGEKVFRLGDLPSVRDALRAASAATQESKIRRAKAMEETSEW
jgi:hypothetical protein